MMDQRLFEETWLGKRVRCKGERFGFNKGDTGIVTAALYRRFGVDTTIFAVNFDTPDTLWITFHIEDKDFEVSMNDFEVIE